MYRFYMEQKNSFDDIITITGNDVNHIKNVLRLKVGDEVIVNDTKGGDYYCEITEINNDSILCAIKDIIKNASELPVRITLFQGMPKSDKMDLIIQKAVELGVFEVIPVLTKRTIVKIDPKKENKKIERYNSISISAAKQSGRGIIPEVKGYMSFKEAINYSKSLEMNIIPYEEAKGMDYSKRIIEQVKGKKSLGIFIGPEGGFSKEEIDLALMNNISTITLGKRILRTETAGLATLAVIMYAVEED